MKIDKKSINQAQKIIWDFMWEEKRCMGKPEVCMLPKSKGGLDIPCFGALRKVRRLKCWLIYWNTQGLGVPRH